MYSVDQTKYIIDNILDNVVGKNNHKFVSRMAGEAVHRYDLKNRASTIEIGENHMADINDSGNLMVSNDRLAYMLITTFHEINHSNQFTNIFQNKSSDESDLLMCFDAIGAESMPRYYKDSEIYNNEIQDTLKYNYRLMFHEINAEMLGISDAYDYMVHNMNMSEDDVDVYIMNAVNSKIKNSSHYWIDRKEYKSTQEIIDAFNDAFENSKYTQRNIAERMLKNDIHKPDGEILKEFDTDFRKALIQDWKFNKDKESIADIIHKTEDGGKQSEMVACVMVKYKPSLKREYPIISDYIFDEQKLFGRNLHIKPPLIECLKSKIIDIVDNKCVQNNGNEVQKDVN